MEEIVEKYRWYLAIENVKSALENVLPGQEVEGDPFWAIMEVDRDGVNKGIYHTVIQAGKKVLPLYERKTDAENVLRQPDLKWMAVRGISRGHMRVLVEFQKKGFIQLGVCAFVRDDGNLGVFCPTAEHVKLMLEHMGRWHDDI